MRKKRVIVVLAFALTLLMVGVATALAASPARLDPGFGAGGFARTALPPMAGVGMADQGDRVARDPSGRLVVVGGVGDRMLVARYLADGTLDPSFGEAGLAEVALQGAVQATAVAIEPGGGILVGGSSGTRQPRAVLVKLTADGALDPSFQGPNSPPGTANVGPAKASRHSRCRGGRSSSAAKTDISPGWVRTVRMTPPSPVATATRWCCHRPPRARRGSSGSAG